MFDLNSPWMLWVGVGTILAVMGLFSLLVLLLKQYKRCPSNRVLVIYGKTRKGQAARTVHGGAAFVIPLLQDYAYLNLEPIQIEIPLRGALSVENIRVNVPSVFTVAVGIETAVMQNAAIRLLIREGNGNVSGRGVVSVQACYHGTSRRSRGEPCGYPVIVLW